MSLNSAICDSHVSLNSAICDSHVSLNSAICDSHVSLNSAICDSHVSSNYAVYDTGMTLFSGITLILKTTETLDRTQVKGLLQRLEICRNQEHNTSSDV